MLEEAGIRTILCYPHSLSCSVMQMSLKIIFCAHVFVICQEILSIGSISAVRPMFVEQSEFRSAGMA